MAFYNPGFQYQNPYLQQQQQVQPQIQSSGMIVVRNETEARNYPVAPGNSVMFKDESGPFVYVKTMGISQFDQPNFDKYRLVKEDAKVEEAPKAVEYVTREEFESFKDSLKEGKKDDE